MHCRHCKRCRPPCSDCCKFRCPGCKFRRRGTDRSRCTSLDCYRCTFQLGRCHSGCTRCRRCKRCRRLCWDCCKFRWRCCKFRRHGTDRSRCKLPGCCHCKSRLGKCRSGCTRCRRCKHCRPPWRDCCKFPWRRCTFLRRGTDRWRCKLPGCCHCTFQLGKCRSGCTRYRRCKRCRRPCSGYCKYRSLDCKFPRCGTDRWRCT